MLIAVPTGIKIFNWLVDDLGRLAPVPDGHAASPSASSRMFIIGGLSGIMHASPPVDLQQTDTYFVVAHFHYVLFGGMMLGLFAGIYYWFPKMTGRLLDERLGKRPLLAHADRLQPDVLPHALPGLIGMPRRIYTYAPGSAGTSGTWSARSARSPGRLDARVPLRTSREASGRARRRARTRGTARTLEWAIPSPPPRLQLRVAPDGPPPGRPLANQHPDARGPGLETTRARRAGRADPHAGSVVLAPPDRARDDRAGGGALLSGLCVDPGGS